MFSFFLAVSQRSAAKRSETGLVFVKVFFFLFVAFSALSVPEVHCNNACLILKVFLQCSINAIAMKLQGTKGNSAIVCILQWRHNDIIRCQVTLNQRLILKNYLKINNSWTTYAKINNSWTTYAINFTYVAYCRSLPTPYFVHRYDPILTLASGLKRKFKFKELYTQYEKK